MSTDILIGFLLGLTFSVVLAMVFLIVYAKKYQGKEKWDCAECSYKSPFLPPNDARMIMTEHYRTNHA